VTDIQTPFQRYGKGVWISVTDTRHPSRDMGNESLTSSGCPLKSSLVYIYIYIGHKIITQNLVASPPCQSVKQEECPDEPLQ